MGNNDKYSAVNMSTTEPEKENINTSTNNNINDQVSSNFKDAPIRHINFNQTNAQKNIEKINHKVRQIDTSQLFEDNDKKMRPKDIKTVLIPAIVLILIAILNELFVIPIFLEKITPVVFSEGLHTYALNGGFTNPELLELAGLTAVSAYSIFSICLLGFSIYNIFRLVYIKRDLMERVTKILLYSFLIGIIIAGIDIFIKYNLTELIVKVTSFYLHSFSKFV